MSGIRVMQNRALVPIQRLPGPIAAPSFEDDRSNQQRRSHFNATHLPMERPGRPIRRIRPSAATRPARW